MKGQAAAATATTEFIASGHSHYIQVYSTIHTACNFTAANVSPATRPSRADISVHVTAGAAAHVTAHAATSSTADATISSTADTITSFTADAVTISTADAVTSSTAGAAAHVTVHATTSSTADAATNAISNAQKMHEPVQLQITTTATARCSSAVRQSKPHIITRNCNHFPQPHAHSAYGPSLSSLSRHCFFGHSSAPCQTPHQMTATAPPSRAGRQHLQRWPW